MNMALENPQTESAMSGLPERPTLLVFSDDWGRHPSSCQHLIKRLKKTLPCPLGEYHWDAAPQLGLVYGFPWTGKNPPLGEVG